MPKFTTENQPKNRGRKKGSVNKTTAILRDATPQVLEKLIQKALDGDIQASSLILKYTMPPLKAESRRVDLQIKSDAKNIEIANAILDSTLSGECCPSVATELIDNLIKLSQVKNEEMYLNDWDDIFSKT